jgi:hypothetical protein
MLACVRWEANKECQRLLNDPSNKKSQLSPDDCENILGNIAESS